MTRWAKRRRTLRRRAWAILTVVIPAVAPMVRATPAAAQANSPVVANASDGSSASASGNARAPQIPMPIPYRPATGSAVPRPMAPAALPLRSQPSASPAPRIPMPIPYKPAPGRGSVSGSSATTPAVPVPQPTAPIMPVAEPAPAATPVEATPEPSVPEFVPAPKPAESTPTPEPVTRSDSLFRPSPSEPAEVSPEEPPAKAEVSPEEPPAKSEPELESNETPTPRMPEEAKDPVAPVEFAAPPPPAEIPDSPAPVDLPAATPASEPTVVIPASEPTSERSVSEAALAAPTSSPPAAPTPSVPLEAATPATSPQPVKGSQTLPTPPVPSPATPSVTDRIMDDLRAKMDPQIRQAECTSCGGFHGGGDGTFGPTFCGTGGCIAGRKPCTVPPESCTLMGAFCRNLYESLCCPDPCYEPGWVPAANAAFFTDYARPWTVTRIRFDRGWFMTAPNRNEYFLKNAPLSPVHPPNLKMAPSLSFSQLYLYQEIASARGSFFIEMPYRQISPRFGPTSAGFGDLNLGVKSLWFDTELLVVSFQFKTYIPTGNSMAGLGTGHVSLEPSVLASLQLTESTYLQGQIAQWIPIAGTQGIAGGVFGSFFSLNQILYKYTPNSMLIGTFEADTWSFQNGGYTGITGPNNKNGHFGSQGSYCNIGPGLRMSLCNQIDFGGAITFPVTSGRWGDPYLRVEMRFLF